jgi:hypothetical protein
MSEESRGRREGRCRLMGHRVQIFRGMQVQEEDGWKRLHEEERGTGSGGSGGSGMARGGRVVRRM